MMTMSSITLLLLLLLILFSIPLFVMARRGYGKTAVPSGPTGGRVGKAARSGPKVRGDGEGDPEPPDPGPNGG